MKTLTSNLRVTFAVLLLIVAVSSLSLAQSYNSHAFLWTQSGGMQDIGVVGGLQDSNGYAINQFGEVVGSSETPPSQNVTSRWTASAGMQPLYGTKGQYCYAVAVNNSGAIAVTCDANNLTAAAFLWTQGGGLENIGTLGGGWAFATGMNKAQEMVGYSATADGATHAFLWTQTAGMQDLGVVQGYSQAWAISDTGYIVGRSLGPDGQDAAVLWKGGMIKVLGHGIAYGVNNAGHVVGATYTTSISQHAFLWTPQAGMEDLGLLNGAVAAFAQGINNFDQVVGWDITRTVGGHAFLWTSTAGLQDLGTLGGPYSLAFAINDAGQVTGYSDVPSQ
jgi:probable HAF family extracellular repeat protein